MIKSKIGNESLQETGYSESETPKSGGFIPRFITEVS